MGGFESVSGWGVCAWVFRVFRGFKVDYRVFYGFLGWVNECGATARCFMGFCGLWGFT